MKKKPETTIDRRNFLRMGLVGIPFLAGCGGALLGKPDGGTVSGDGGTITDAGAIPGPDGSAGDAGILADAGVPSDAGVCRATNRDIEGPFHRDDAPFRTVLAPADEPGVRLYISGRVLGPDCATPLSDVIVDVWHANDAGHYDNDGSMGAIDPNTFLLRGRMRTGADGTYAFESVLPGRYLNGPTFRPRHIHYKVLAPGRAELTTQLYFAGDEFIPGDPWASTSRAIIPLRQDGAGAHGVFDVVLS